MGVLAYLLVYTETKDELLSGLAFSIGFVALLLARSELFTENFLVPVITVVAGRSGLVALGRLWVLTLLMNLVGGWIISGLIITGLPTLKPAARTLGAHYAHLGQNLSSLSLAILAGAAITLMTRMVNGTESMPARVIAVISAAFILAGLKLSHSILESLLIFAALHTGHAPFGYLDWLGWFGWTVLGNIIGGVGLVTLLRLIRSKPMLDAHREAASAD
jgi:formate-nitrite transporter family protein